MEISRLIEGRASSNVISSTVDAPVREAIALLASKRIGAVPIMEGGRIVGIFSERDVIYRLADDALALMTKRRIRHLPVVDGETMCGFISIGDLVKARLDEIQHEAEAMREYIRTA